MPIITLDNVIDWVSGKRTHIRVGNYVHATLFVGNNSFALKINDNSFEPFFLRNSVLIVDTDIRLNVGKYILIQENAKAQLYQITKISAEITLIKPFDSSNILKYDPKNPIIGLIVQEIRTL